MEAGVDDRGAKMTFDPTDPRGWPPVAMEQPPFALLVGSRLTSISTGQVEAELVVRPDLLNRNGFLHGGAILGVADNLGGTAAFVNLGRDEGTTTIESKTNFLRIPPPKGVCPDLVISVKCMAYVMRYNHFTH